MPDPHDPLALAAAADAGDAAAAHRLAVLAAIGLGLPKDWPGALGRLEQAARLGHPTAGQQLALLSGSAGIDLAAWLTAHNIKSTHLSLSDERDYVVAFVVMEQA